MTEAEKILNDLHELYQRLILNYNDGVPFKQMEEDRLTVGNAIDLLNSKDTEILRLKIENLKLQVRIKNNKIEAYKDLAEKLKAKKKRAYFESEGFYWCILVEDIDAVLKEMG